MRRKLVTVAAVFILFSPVLFSETPPVNVSGTGGQGTGSGPLPGSGRQAGAEREKKQAFAVQVSTDNVDDILTFEERLQLTSEQIVSIHMIGADAQREAAEKYKTVLDCQREFEKSLNQIKPNFVYIRAMLKDLKEAQAEAQAVPVNAYEKAYMLLTDSQKGILEFLRAVRLEENDKKAAAAAEAVH